MQLFVAAVYPHPPKTKSNKTTSVCNATLTLQLVAFVMPQNTI